MHPYPSTDPMDFRLHFRTLNNASPAVHLIPVQPLPAFVIHDKDGRRLNREKHQKKVDKPDATHTKLPQQRKTQSKPICNASDEKSGERKQVKTVKVATISNARSHKENSIQNSHKVDVDSSSVEQDIRDSSDADNVVFPTKADSTDNKEPVWRRIKPKTTPAKDETKQRYTDVGKEWAGHHYHAPANSFQAPPWPIYQYPPAQCGYQYADPSLLGLSTQQPPRPMFMPPLNQLAVPPWCLYHFPPSQEAKGPIQTVPTDNANKLTKNKQDPRLDFSIPPPLNWTAPEVREKRKSAVQKPTIDSEYAEESTLNKHDHNATEVATLTGPTKHSSSKNALNRSNKTKSKVTSVKVVPTHPDDTSAVTIETAPTRLVPLGKEAGRGSGIDLSFHLSKKQQRDNVLKQALNSTIKKSSHCKSDAQQIANVIDDSSPTPAMPTPRVLDSLSSVLSEISGSSKQRSRASISPMSVAPKHGWQSPYLMSGAADGLKSAVAVRDMSVLSTSSTQTNAIAKRESQRAVADSDQADKKPRSTPSSSKISQTAGARILNPILSTCVNATAASVTPPPDTDVPDMDDTWTVNLHDVLPTDSASQCLSSAAKTASLHKHAVLPSTKTARASAGSALGSNYQAPTVETLSSTDSSNSRAIIDPLVKIRITQHKFADYPGNNEPAVAKVLQSSTESVSESIGRLRVRKNRQAIEAMATSSRSALNGTEYVQHRAKSSVMPVSLDVGSSESQTSESGSRESSSTRIVYFRHIPRSSGMELVSRYMRQTGNR